MLKDAAADAVMCCVCRGQVTMLAVYILPVFIFVSTLRILSATAAEDMNIDNFVWTNKVNYTIFSSADWDYVPKTAAFFQHDSCHFEFPD